MSKIAFLFPGQGSQFVGMGKDIFENYQVAKDIFQKADDSLGFEISKICFQGPDEELVKTENTQPAILTTSVAILKVLEEKLGIKADVSAGLSLGEYTSLVYSGAMDFSDAVSLVKKRGKYMQETVPFGKGTMAAVIGLDREKVEEVINEAKGNGIVEGANYNCPGQIVLSGEVKAVEKACEIAKSKGAKRAKLLPVSAPFHSSLLIEAGEKLNEELKNINISEINFPVISNVTGKYIKNKDDIKNLLTNQVSKSVLWEDTIELMLNDGVDTFIEIGPGKALTAFTKKIAKKLKIKVNTYSVSDIDSLNSLIEKFH